MIILSVQLLQSTSRDPRFLPEDRDDETVLVPVYDLIDQTGLDLQMTQGGWLWKVEAINRYGQGDRFYAFTGGFEYTFVNVKSSGLDLGVLAEYSYDERGKLALTPFDDDIFFRSTRCLQRRSEYSNTRRSAPRSRHRGELHQRRGEPSFWGKLDAGRRSKDVRRRPARRHLSPRNSKGQLYSAQLVMAFLRTSLK